MEVMIVLAIIVILASASLPLINHSLVNFRLRKSADILRSEWTELRIRAMEEGQIFCFRGMIGGNSILIDRVLDVHFAAAMRMTDETRHSRREPIEGTPEFYERDQFEAGGFTGEEEDFILRDPSSASEATGARIIILPEGVFFSDALAVPDERAAYYLGFTVGDEENGVQEDPVANRDTRFGETKSRNGITWSVPVFFFPDGTTSTAAALLKNNTNRCLEVRLRGLTGTTSIGEITYPDQYTGELDPGTLGLSSEELTAIGNRP